jgi:hypothetical protein
MNAEISATLHETRTRFQELMAEIQKAVMSKSEAFVHALNSFMEAGYSLRNLLK